MALWDFVFNFVIYSKWRVRLRPNGCSCYDKCLEDMDKSVCSTFVPIRGSAHISVTLFVFTCWWWIWNRNINSLCTNTLSVSLFGSLNTNIAFNFTKGFKTNWYIKEEYIVIFIEQYLLVVYVCIGNIVIYFK